MKVSFASAAVFVTLLASFTNAAVISHLLPRADDLPSYLGERRFFYRAVYKEEIADLPARYPVGYPPQSHKTNAGDFSPAGTGGLYVFNNPEEAMTWGDCFTRGTGYERNGYYLVTFVYNPVQAVTRHTFTNGDPNWVGFVNANYAQGTQPSGIDIIEGPISTTVQMRHVLYERAGELVWQGAFITPAALSTLTVYEVRRVAVTRPRSQRLRTCCEGCVTM